MPNVWDRVQAAGKAFAGGLAGAVVSVLFTTVTDADAVVNPDAPDSANAVVQLPNTQAEWITLLVSVAIGFLLPWVKRNYPSVVEANRQVALAKKRVEEGKQSQ